MKTTHIIVVALIASAMTTPAFTHDGATGIVKERMEAMSNLGKAVKNIAEMVREILPYDASSVRFNALIIKNHAGPAMTKLFPRGSQQKASQARPRIWSNWDEFTELAYRLETLATGLGIAADNGLSVADVSKSGNKRKVAGTNSQQSEFATMPVGSIFSKLAKTCTACHEKFRLKTN